MSKKLSDYFSELDTVYGYNSGSTSSSSLGLKEVDAKINTDKEIEDIVKSQLDAYYNKKQSDVNTSIENEYVALENKKKLGAEEFDSYIDKVNSLYDTRLNDASNEALKRGLARSSIIMGQIEGFDSGRINEILSANKTFDEKLAALNNEIENLANKKSEKISELGDDYGAEYYKKINELIKERDKKLMEVTDFNNKVKQAELDYQEKLKKQSSTTNDDNAKRQLDALQREKYQKALDYYSQLDRATARSQYNNDAALLKQNLGDFYGILGIALGF